MSISTHNQVSWEEDRMKLILTDLRGWKVFTGNPGTVSAKLGKSFPGTQWGSVFQVEGVAQAKAQR